jgi:eight-cysteine-cluster-containing protein
MNVQKKGNLFVISIFAVFILSLSLISAGWFSDAWNTITGKDVVSVSCANYPPPYYCAKGESIVVTGVDSNGCYTYGCNASVVSSCADSDGGINYYVWGSVSVDNPDGSGTSGIDSCGGTRILEYYCNGSKIQSVGYNCSYGCSDGACVNVSSYSCTLPWGGTIANGSSVIAYSSSSVACGSTCSSQTRTCAWGVLSGSYQYSKCSVSCGFCGDSTNAACSSNSDCKVGGCSSQVCQGINESIFSTCDMKDCYNAASYGLKCECSENKCKWTNVTNISNVYPSPFVVTGLGDAAIIYGTNVGISALEQTFASNIKTNLLKHTTSSSGIYLLTDAEIDSVFSNNLIIVGSIANNCSNFAFEKVLGASCKEIIEDSDIGPGQFLITVVNSPLKSGKIALLIEGYDAADVVNGVNYLLSHSFSTSVGSTYIGGACTDSDGGLNYYVKGSVSGNIGSGVSYEDYCLDANSLNERYCTNDSSKFTYNYLRPNGCQDGACVQYLENASTCYTLLDWESLTVVENGKSYEVSLTFIGETSAKFSVNGELTTYLEEGQTYQLSDGVYIGVLDILYSSKEDGISKVSFAIATESSFFANGGNCSSQETQVCSSLIDKIKNPVSSEYTPWGYSSNYSGKMWVGSSRENYTGYYVGYYTKSGLEYDYSSVEYSLIVFDNKDINLSEFVEGKYDDMACRREYSYSGGDYYFICNWNALNGESASENWNYFNLFWYNKNVLVKIDVYYGRDLTDEEIAELSSKKIEDFMNSLIDNPSQYLWDKFSIPYYVEKEIYDSLEKCGSEVKKGYSLSWSCKTEPVVCPPHGYQTRTCSAYNYETSKYDTKESKIYCSPGICSGCYVPRWFGQHGGDNKCIPYGFRFEQETGDFVEAWVEEEEGEQSISQGGGGDGYLEVTSNTTATLVLYGENKNLTLNLVKGQKSEINFSEYEDEDYILVLLPKEIGYYGAGNSENFVKFTVLIKYFGKEYLKANMYCDIDGKFKIQKTKEYGGEWARCQNNYECYSNVCSAGECIEVHDMIESASALKVIWVRIGCRISSFFSSETYDGCVSNSLGADYLSSQTD